jgi:Mn-dependent DtxR family transcriptional regulator
MSDLPRISYRLLWEECQIRSNDVREEYFRVSPPSVHQMLLALKGASFIRRQPSTPRSIELLVDPEELPELL